MDNLNFLTIVYVWSSTLLAMKHKIPINTIYSLLFFIWQKHIFENLTDWNSGFFDLILLFFLAVLYFRQWLYSWRVN